MQSFIAAMYTQVVTCLLILALSTIETGAQKRIIFGSEAKIGEIPFQAFLVYHNDYPNEIIQSCGGSLVHPMWVLTAGHCIFDPVYYPILDVRMGGIGEREMPFTQRVAKSERFTHSKYNDKNLDNDVGMVKVPKPFVLNANVQVIAMAPADIGDLVGLRAIVSGFGYSEKGPWRTNLQRTEVQIISHDKCETSPESEILMTENTICTKFAEVNYSGGCSGDSGGPLFTKKDGKPLLVGVTSWYKGAELCKAAYHNGFMRVSAFRDWIRETMEKGGQHVIEP